MANDGVIFDVSWWFVVVVLAQIVDMSSSVGS
jgi:hypothetical protein